MDKKFAIIIITVLTLFSGNTSFADNIVATAGGGWRSWTIADINENGNPYWDGNSVDSNQPYNIGNYLTNTGGFTGGNGPGSAIQYWGNANGGADTITMQRSGGSNSVVLKAEVAGYSNANEFGYIDSSGSHVLFAGGANPPTAAVFSPTSNYVFYLLSPEGLFTSNMSNNEGYQHFAIFQESAGAYWIGMEDLKSISSADRDYNDMIVKISSVSVPEPAGMLLLGIGLAGLAGIRRKMK